MEFDYGKLRGKIKEVFCTQNHFAAAMEMGRVSLSQRLNNTLQFSQREIDKACALLSIPPEAIPAYFLLTRFRNTNNNPPAVKFIYRKEMAMENRIVTINETRLPVKEYQGQRVVTMKEIDAVHQRPEGTADRNFRANQKRFLRRGGLLQNLKISIERNSWFRDS